MCELLASDNVHLDIPGAKYFCEKAQSLDPHNPAVFSLRERLIATENDNPNDVAKLLLNELEARPADVNLRVRLLRHFLQNNQVKEAYKHACDIEGKNLDLFLNNLNWYETIAEVLVRYQRDSSLNVNLTYEFWILLISVLDKLISISLDERSDNIKSSPECIAMVFNFDQTLSLAAQNLSTCSDRQLTQEFLCHYRGQLCLHLATLLYKQAKKDLIKFKEVSNIVLPLLFAAYHAQPAKLNSLWLNHTTELKRDQIKRWHKEAAFRCSQAGHVILAAVRDRRSTVVEKAILHSSGLWREQLFLKLFITREQQNKMKTSYFVTCPQLTDIVVKLPDPTDVIVYDEEAQLVYPSSLHHYIWLGLNQKLAQIKCTAFSGLQYSIKNLQNCAAETLNLLDIEAFVYCATLCAQLHIENLRHLHYNTDRPLTLPAAVTDQLGTLNQAKWLTAAYKMYRNEYGGDLGEIRLNLIRGIEVIRCVGNHGLDVKLLVLLANIFAERANNLTKQSEIEFNGARAELYWRAALPLLEKLKNNQICTYSSQRLFEYRSKEMPLVEVFTHMDSGKLFIARQMIKQKDYEKALQMLEPLKDPYASFYQAQVYKALADEQVNQCKTNVTSQMHSQNVILLTKARDCLYLTLDRLREPVVDRNHPLNTKLGSEIENIERTLSKVDPDATSRAEYEGFSDENESSTTGSTEPHFSSYSVLQNSFLNGSAHGIRNDSQALLKTPRKSESFRREARPSPERLDAQLRQLAASKDVAISHLLDQNRLIVESHRNLVDELRNLRLSTVGELHDIRQTVTDLKDIKQSVDELKHSVDELQSFRNVTDLVYEMKKEIAELKKETGKMKTSQLIDDDVYPLDEELGDYNLGTNITGFNPTIYPSYPSRIPGGNSLAYAPPAIYPGMIPMAYHYGLGLPPQAGK